MKKILSVILALTCVFALAACGGAGNTAEPSNKESYYFKSGDTKIEMNVDATELIKKLGEPSGRFEEESCAGLGMEITYYYNGFDLVTYRTTDSDAEKTYNVYFKDDTVATVEGVRVGDSAEKVISTYGVGAEGDTQIKTSKGNCDIYFVLSDGVVTSVEYIANDAVSAG